MKTIENETERTSTPRYALRKGCGRWEVTFEGERATFKDEKGAGYVAHLLLNPPAEPIHGLALALAVRDRRRERDAVTEVVHPFTGEAVVVPVDAVVRQRSLELDDAEAARELAKSCRRLEALLDDPDVIEPVKAEVRAELDEVRDFLARHPLTERGPSQKTADAVGRAIRRLCAHLLDAVDDRAQPHPVLRAFGAHLKHYVLQASHREMVHAGSRLARAGGGCFTYCPPAGVVWRRQ
jgi:hypothetical protein